MAWFVEAVFSLFPPDAGGRLLPVAPRDGSYRPFVRIGDDVLRLRVIEGPPLLGPGEEGRVVAELETEGDAVDDERFAPGAELDLVELEGRVVGIVNVLRHLR